MAGECGEACNFIKKLRRLDLSTDQSGKRRVSPHKSKKARKLIRNISHELADMVIYADLLAARLGIDLEDAIVEKFNIVSEERGCKIKL